MYNKLLQLLFIAAPPSFRPGNPASVGAVP